MSNVTKSGKNRKVGYSFSKIVHKNRGKAGAVTLGQHFSAQERDLWHRLQDYVQDNYAPPASSNRKREHIAMVILEAAYKTFGLEVPEMKPASDVHVNQLPLPGTVEETQDSVTNEEQVGESVELDSDDTEEEPSALPTEIRLQHSVDYEEPDVDYRQEQNDFAHDDDCEVLPLEES